ncbi:MAG TPA: hypothetical protein VHA37_09160, partial [Candidatus Saccharimonadales bacterium]|nr:hypothetical protein [Candidatus Saccharimonadales bacterium]
GSFVETYGNHLLPRLKILPPNGLLLYDLAEIPVRLAPLPWESVYVPGEGIMIVRPFVFFLFWAFIGLAFVWAGVRRKALGLDVRVQS